MNRRKNIYVMMAGDRYIKIGVAQNPDGRLMHIQTGSFMRITIEAAREYEKHNLVERAWHSRLAKYRVSGEWFDVGKRIARVVIRMVADGSIPRCGVVVSGARHQSRYFVSPLRKAGIPVRAIGVLEERGVRSVAQLARLAMSDLLRMRNIGKKTANEIALVLVRLGYWEEAK